jgi:hypothetical protein
LLAAARAADLPPRRQWLLRPPGVLFFVAVAFAVVEGVWVSSLHDFTGRLLTDVIWGSLAVVWGIRLLAAAVVRRVRFGAVEWARWLAVPLILGLVFAWTLGGGPFALRLAWSRSAMDQAAAEVIAGGSTNREWIGLWPVERVERLPGGMRFIVSGCGFIDRCGFAYSTSGSSLDIADPESGDRYEHLDGNWFEWTEHF